MYILLIYLVNFLPKSMQGETSVSLLFLSIWNTVYYTEDAQ